MDPFTAKRLESVITPESLLERAKVSLSSMPEAGVLIIVDGPNSTPEMHACGLSVARAVYLLRRAEHDVLSGDV